MKDNFMIGLCQMKVLDDKWLNLGKAIDMMTELPKKGRNGYIA